MQVPPVELTVRLGGEVPAADLLGAAAELVGIRFRPLWIGWPPEALAPGERELEDGRAVALDGDPPDAASILGRAMDALKKKSDDPFREVALSGAWESGADAPRITRLRVPAISLGDAGALQREAGIPPIADWDDRRLVLDWSTLLPALRLEVSRAEGEESILTTLRLSVSPVLLGLRTGWLEAMLRIHVADAEARPPHVHATSLIESLSAEAERLRPFEAGLGGLLAALWSSIRQVADRFQDASPTTAIEFGGEAHQEVEAAAAAARDRMEPETWMERMGWEAPEPDRRRAITYWSTRPDLDDFRKLIKSASGRKSCWEALVDVLRRRPVSDETIGHLLGWVADPNWPGAGRAWEHVRLVAGRRALPIIDRELARDLDEGWKSSLQQLRAEIESDGDSASPPEDPVPVAPSSFDEGLQSTQPRVQQIALAAIGDLGAPGAMFAPDAEDLLASADAAVRACAARTLGEMGPAARDSLPALKKAAGDPDEGVRAQVRMAIERVTSHS